MQHVEQENHQRPSYPNFAKSKTIYQAHITIVSKLCYSGVEWAKFEHNRYAVFDNFEKSGTSIYPGMKALLATKRVLFVV